MGSSKKTLCCIIFFIPFVGPSATQAKETKVVVRALAKDAMFIGTSMGGAKIVIREVVGGTILAQGITKGGAGYPHIINTFIHHEGFIQKAKCPKYGVSHSGCIFSL